LERFQVGNQHLWERHRRERSPTASADEFKAKSRATLSVNKLKLQDVANVHYWRQLDYASSLTYRVTGVDPTLATSEMYWYIVERPFLTSESSINLIDKTLLLNGL